MTETLPSQNDEISLLDLAVAVAESWMLLVFGPLLIGLAVFSYLHFSQSDSYRAEAMVAMSQEEAALLQSASVIDPAIQAGLSDANHGTVAAARQALLENRLSVQKLDNADYFRVSVTGTSPEETQALLTRLLDQLIQNSVPRGDKRRVLEQKLEALERSRQSLIDNLERLNAIYDQAGEGNWSAMTMLSNANQSSVLLISSIATTEQDILSTQLALQGSVSPADIIQEPTLSEPESQRTLLIAVVAAIASGFVLLLFAFVRAGLKNAAQNAESADKMRRIKDAFRLGRSKPAA